jgi:flagellin-like hook-associated protein FlgL
MAGIVPLPTTRISSLLVRQRLSSQLQRDQLEIFRLQNQLSTGYRISRPSEDAPAAQRAATLQRLIERKTQLKSNVDTGLSFLTSTDVALQDVATLLADIKGEALGASSTASTEAERDVIAGNVRSAIDELLRVANQRFRGRYLFAGSQTNLEPYAWQGNSIQYFGDEKLIENFSDLDVLFSTNAPGAGVFGGLSEEVLGGVDLNPQLSADTLVSSLRGGRGISSNGALRISDGTNEVTVDLANAVTVGDIVRLIEENPPAGRSISASITGTGLTLQLDSAGGGNLTVTEVGSGRTASELGILNQTGTGTGPLVGTDLDPTILKTTRLDDLLGTKSRARLNSAGNNNDILIEAAANGAALNGVTVQFVNDAAPGGESATFAAGTLTVHIAAGVTNASTVVNAINSQGMFTARLDPTDSTHPSLAGTGQVALASTAVTAGGGGANFDPTGIVVENGDQVHTLDFNDAETVEDLLNVLNGSGAGLHAAINAAGTGIDVRSRVSGTEFWIRENGGQTASQLGVRWNEYNHPLDIPTIDGAEFTVVVNLGNIDLDPEDEYTEFDVDLAGATTVQEVLDAINSAPGNNSGGVSVQATLTANRELQIVDTNGRQLTIRSAPGSEATDFLGITAPGGTERTEGSGTIVGNPLTYPHTGSVFTTLTQLYDAIQDGDVAAMERAIAQIDDDINRATFARAEVGAREQALAIAQRNLEDEDVHLRSALSEEIEVDLVEAISNLTARQVALQASLQSMGAILQTTLLDYL